MTAFGVIPCLVWTACLAAAAAAGRSPTAVAAATAAVLAVGVLRARSARPAALAAAMFVPLAVPLVLIHGVVNPGYEATGSIAGVPVRAGGVAHAADVAARLLALACAGALWRYTSADAVIDALIRWRVPPGGLVLAAQAISIIALLGRRAAGVILAQQARGLPVRGTPLQRVLALPSVVLPVTIRVLSEVDDRAVVLATRGCGTGPITSFSDAPFPWADVAAAVLGAGGCAAALLLV